MYRPQLKMIIIFGHKTNVMHLIWISIFIKGLLSCRSSSPAAETSDGDDDDDVEEDLLEENVTINKDPMAEGWGGWNPPAEVLEDWKKWMDDYKTQSNDTDFLDQMDPEKRLELEKQRGAGSGWPDGWKDLGEGAGGVPPPPWAYVPKNTGKPPACYLPMLRGRCKKKIDRWGYNAHIDKCSAFVYTGCRGNKNNFATKLKCEETCVAPPPSDCNNEPHIYVDDIITS